MFRSLWLDDTGVEFNDPRVTILTTDLSGLPPTAIYYGADEILAGDATELARRAQTAGNDVLLQSVPAGQHSFILAAGRVPKVDHAINEMGEWLRTKLGLAELAASGA
jgi:acetyl esterase/lipase